MPSLNRSCNRKATLCVGIMPLEIHQLGTTTNATGALPEASSLGFDRPRRRVKVEMVKDE
jgi:hypothetical protein